MLARKADFPFYYPCLGAKSVTFRETDYAGLVAAGRDTVLDSEEPSAEKDCHCGRLRFVAGKFDSPVRV